MIRKRIVYRLESFNDPELTCLRTIKCYVLLCNTNNLVLNQSFVDTQLNG